MNVAPRRRWRGGGKLLSGLFRLPRFVWNEFCVLVVDFPEPTAQGNRTFFKECIRCPTLMLDIVNLNPPQIVDSDLNGTTQIPD